MSFFWVLLIKAVICELPPNPPFEFTIAGLYTIHADRNCAHLQPDHVVLSEAAEYAVRYANQHILQDINLQLYHDMADTCDDRSKTLQETVFLIKNAAGFCKGNLTAEELATTRLAAIGSFNCDLAENINYLLQAFCIPVISSLCTANQLDNGISFPFFARTASDDIYRAQVMYDVLMSQEWYHIAVITDVSTTGQSLWSQFNNMLYYCTMPLIQNPLFRAPCIEKTFEIDCNNPQKLLMHQEELRRFLVASTVMVYMIFAEDSCINKILYYVQVAGFVRGNLQFVLPSTALNNSLDILEYAYAVDTYGEPVESFIEALQNTTIQETRNEFLIELIMVENLCCWSSDHFFAEDCPFSIDCTGNETIGDSLPALGANQARKVIDSVMWVAQAVRDLYLEFCTGSVGFCRSFLSNFTGNAFFEKMLNTQFTSFDSTQTFQVLNGSGAPVYNIWQRQNGTWVTVLRKYNPLLGPEPSEENMLPLDIPIFEKIHREAETCQSYCEKQVVNFAGQSCCWSCQSCAEYYYINESYQECMPCPDNKIPNDLLNGCVSYEREELFLKPTGEMNVIIVLNAIGILLTLPALILLFWRRNTPMVRAATPDLAYQQTVFICLLFVTSALMLPSTSGIVCGVVWGFSALLLTATHSVSLSRALRISRAEFFVRFISRAKSPQKASIILHTGMLVIQLFIVILWILLRPPRIEWDRKTLFPKCSSNNESQTIVLLLNPAVLLLLTLYFQKQACANQYIYQVKQARIGLAGTLCFLVNYLVLMALILIEQSTEQVRTIVLMCIPMVTGFIAYATNLLPTTWEVLTKSKQNHQEYVTRQRSRQFQQGNIMYYVESVIFNRPKGHTINSINSVASMNSAVNSVVEK